MIFKLLDSTWKVVVYKCTKLVRVSVCMRKQEKQMKKRMERRFCVYVYMFLAVNQYANEAWSVILLQLISLYPSSPGLGTTHTHRHAWVNPSKYTHLCLLTTTLYF